MVVALCCPNVVPQDFSRRRSRRPFLFPATLVASALVALAPSRSLARPLPTRSFFQLSSSNGHGAVMLDLRSARVTHFREHLYATEEPKLDASGNEVWEGADFGAVASRDLLFDAY